MQIQIIQDRLLSGHKSSIYTLERLNDSSFLSAGGEGYVVEWPTGQGDKGQLIIQVDAQIFCMAYHSGKDQVWVGDMNGGIYIIDRKRKELLNKKLHHKGGTYILRSYRDEVISSGNDGMISRWSDEDLYPKDSLKLSEQRLRAIAFHPHEPIMAIGGADRKIYILDSAKWHWIQTIDAAHDGTLFDMKFSPDGDHLISGAMDAQLKVWDWQTAAQIHSIPAHNFTINSMQIIADLDILVTASRDNSIKFWNMKNWKLLKVVDNTKKDFHLNSVNAILYDERHKKLISGSDDRTIRSWTIKNI